MGKTSRMNISNKGDSKTPPIKLSEVSPNDREEGYPLDFPKWLRKMLEFIPGGFAWFVIFSPLIFSLLGFSEVLVYYMAFLTVYWGYRGITFTLGIAIGYYRMLRDVEVDWMAKIKDNAKLFEKFNTLKYVYICPVVKEGMDTLEPSFEAYKQSSIGAEKITVVMAIEARVKQQQIENFKKLRKKYKNDFADMRYYVHPNDIPGEVIGVKGANINWATRHFVKDIEGNGEEKKNYLLITCDSDQRPHKKYLAAVMYKYLTDDDPLHKFYSTAVHTFNNNIWRVPPFVRAQSMILTLGLLHEWVFRKASRETFSSYIVNLDTVHKVGYWSPDVGIDDTPFYYNAVVRLDGNFSGVAVYVPTYNDAVENKNFIATYKSFYKQQHRWGWGSIVVPTTLAHFLWNNRISALQKWRYFITLIEKQVVFITIVYLITFALPILNVLSPEYSYSSFSYNLPQAMSIIMTFLLSLNLPVIYYRRKITPPPSGWSIFRHIWDILETSLVTINGLTFTFIPYVQARTELMFGRGMKKNFYATDKVRMQS